MLHYLVGQTQAERGGRIHHFGGQRVAAHLALTKGALHRICTDLAAALEVHGAQTQVVPLCLAQPESAVALHEATAPIADRVELLVANAGRSWAGPLAAQPAEVLDQMLQLNMATVARLCRLYAADFARRGVGAGVNTLLGDAPQRFRRKTRNVVVDSSRKIAGALTDAGDDVAWALLAPPSPGLEEAVEGEGREWTALSD